MISEDAKHGEDLVCSYFACRNGGVKFRYCAHCMAPVAKRNFCRRHDHGMSSRAGGDVDKDEDEDEASVDQSANEKGDAEAKPASIPVAEKGTPKPTVKPPAEKDVSRSSLDVLSKAASSSFLLQAEPPSQPEGQGKRKKPSEDVEKESGEDEAASDEGDPAELANISSKRRRMWNSLLVKRPRTKDPRHLSSWLNEVLTVSDFETSLEQEEPAEIRAIRTESSLPSAEKSKSPKDKDKKTGEKEKKKRKIEGRSLEDGSSSKPKKDEKSLKKSEKGEKKTSDNAEKKSPKKNGSKDSSLNRKEPEDGFAGSFADWRDRKKDKGLIKKGTGSLRKEI